MNNNCIKYITPFIVATILIGAETTDSRDIEREKSFLQSMNMLFRGSGNNEDVLDINTLTTWVTKEGYFTYDADPTHTNGSYLDEDVSVIFSQGLVWGGLLPDVGGASDGSDTTYVKVNGSTYANGLSAGVILDSGIGDDPENYQVWKVNLADNSNWSDWPADKGAPYDDVDGDGVYSATADKPGWPGADQTIWIVANDIGKDISTPPSTAFAGSDPIGIEYQLTMWGYNFPSTNPLGNMNFKKARIIYKGLPDTYTKSDGTDTTYTTTGKNATFDKFYFAQWGDLDVGDYGDDYAGCDLDLSLGYSYNGNYTDAVYDAEGLGTPAVGFDFLYDTGDLGMTSFVYYAAGTAIADADLAKYSGSLQWYNIFEGMLPRPAYPDQSPNTNPVTGEESVFWLDGDPLTGSGWIDGMQIPPGDRRIVMTTGPYTFALGDTLDVVVATIGGMGTNSLSSITVLKYHDTFAQYAYDQEFNLPSAPTAPSVVKSEYDKEVVLNWGMDASATAAIEDVSVKNFEFQGYNVYQYSNSSGSSSKIVATYDKKDLVLTVFDNQVDEETGYVINVPVQFGTDSGISRSISIKNDAFTGMPLSNGSDYYFGVSAYSTYTGAAADAPPFGQLESSAKPLTVRPQAPPPGTEYSSTYGSAVTTTHSSGGATSSPAITVVAPDSLISKSYTMFFSEGPADSISVVESGTDADGNPIDVTNKYSFNYQWNLIETVAGASRGAAGDTVLKNMPIKPDLIDDGSITPTYYGGLEIFVEGVVKGGFGGWDYSGDRWVSGVDWGGAGLFGGLDLGANFFGSDVATADLVPIDCEFTDKEFATDPSGWSEGSVYRRDKGYAYEGIGKIPFKCYDISTGTPRQVNVSYVEMDHGDGTTTANLIWDMGWDGTAFHADGYGAREYIFIHNTDYNGGVDYATKDGTSSDVLFAIWPKERGSRGYLHAEYTLNIFPAIGLSSADIFTFSSTAPTVGDADLVKKEVEKLNVFPNPYYGYHSSEQSSADKWVRFNHMPQKATVRIFNVGGIMVNMLEKDDESQYLNWNLRNRDGLPVASGMYFAYVDMPDVGVVKTLKLAIIQEEQILTRY